MPDEFPMPGEADLSLLDHLHEGVYIVDDSRRIVFWNKGAEAISGFAAAEMLGEQCPGLLDLKGKSVCRESCPFKAGEAASQIRQADVWLRHKNGHNLPVRVKIVPVVEHGNVTKTMALFVGCDSAGAELVSSLANAAMLDPLTNLHNRRFLEYFINTKLQEYERFERKFVVAFIDLDNFRRINNEYGHDAGDEMLLATTRTMKQMTRKTDIFGRWGGEEFVGVFELEDKTAAILLGEKIRRLVAETRILSDKGKPLQVTASVGLSRVRDGDTADSIVKRADRMMYQSKTRGKDRVSYDF